MTSETRKIEALLFVAGEAVAKKELAELVHVSPEEVDTLLQELGESLADHGLSLAITATHVQLITSPDVAEYLAKFQQEESQDLTKAAAETLAIVAYRGPISRYDVDILRGVDSRSILRQLIRRGLIRQVQQAGRTPLYDISEDFLLNMGITKREDLPDFSTLSDSEEIQRILHKD